MIVRPLCEIRQLSDRIAKRVELHDNMVRNTILNKRRLVHALNTRHIDHLRKCLHMLGVLMQQCESDLCKLQEMQNVLQKKNTSLLDTFEPLVHKLSDDKKYLMMVSVLIIYKIIKIILYFYSNSIGY